jgi:ABC-2 type transport system permease protein
MARGSFWALVRHEFSFKGNRRKASRRSFSSKWCVAYIAIIIIIFLSWMTYMSTKNDFQLENTWFFSLGLPYIIFFYGNGNVKREWDNETHGWWLTLPFSRLRLIFAKFAGGLLQVWVTMVAIFMVSFLFGLFITIFLNRYDMQDFLNYLVTGVNWSLSLIGISPIVLSLGMFVAITPYTVFRPLTPLLWILFMSLGSFLYSGIFSKDGSFITNFSGEHQAVLLSYSWLGITEVIISWIITFFIIKILAFLLEKKLSL